MQRKENTGTAEAERMVGGAKHWWAWTCVCLHTPRVRRETWSVGALKSWEQSHAVLLPNLCPHLGTPSYQWVLSGLAGEGRS